MSEEDFVDYLYRISNDKPEYLRIGQFAFNLLYEIDPGIAGCICGGPVDCFYVDENIGKFLGFVYNNFVRK